MTLHTEQLQRMPEMNKEELVLSHLFGSFDSSLRPDELSLPVILDALRFDLFAFMLLLL